VAETFESSSPKDGRLLGGLADCGRGFVQTALERPVAGLVQAVNATKLVQLPELHLVDDPKPSIATGIGRIAGSVVSFYALSRALSPALARVGGAGTLAAVGRSAAMGAIYEGILQPGSDPQNFWSDRFKSASVGAVTFAAYGAAGKVMDSQMPRLALGRILAPEVRGLTASIEYGALSGIAAGLAHAEANAIIKDGSLLPGAEAIADVGTYALFGAGMGAAGWAAERMVTLPSKTITTDSGKYEVTLTYGHDGQPVEVKASHPAITLLGTGEQTMKWDATRDTAGHWFGTAQRTIGKVPYWNDFTGQWFKARIFSPTKVDVNASGVVSVELGENNTLHWTPGGKFEMDLPPVSVDPHPMDLIPARP
jgi:hypothetical protein